MTKEEQLYRQDYCGCIYGLTIQREHQNKLLDELFSPISGATLPASIEERLELYTRRNELEERNQPYKIIKQKFLNYRQFFCKLTEGKNNTVAAYALSYSTLPRKRAQGRIEYTTNHLHHLNRDEIKLITRERFNKLLGTTYTTVKQIIFNPPSLKEELALRTQLLETPYELTPIVVVEQISDKKLTLELDAKVYEDTKEQLVLTHHSK